MDAIELFTKEGKSTGVWCCGKCHKLRVLTLNVQHRDEPLNTQEGAEACCRPKVCPACQKKITDNVFRSTGMCSDCDSEHYRKLRAERLRKQIENATLVQPADYDGPVYCEEGPNGDYGDHYHSDYDHLVESIVDADDYYDEEGKFDPERIPEFAFCCTAEIKQLDLGRAIENLCEDSYEGMDERLDIPESLTAAVQEFNDKNANTLRCYNEDPKRKLPLREAVLDYLEEIKQDCARERMGP